MTPKELLDFKLDGHSTLQYIFEIFDGEGQFDYAYCGVDYEKQKFFEQLAQKIIDAVKE